MNQTKSFRQIISNKIGFKQKLNKFIANNSDPNVGIDRSMSFAKRNRIIFSRNLEEYQSGHMSKSRLVQAILLKVFVLMTVIRFFLSSVFNRKSVNVLMSDANHLLGNQRLCSICMSLSALALSVGLMIFYHEYRHSLTVLEFILDFKQNKLIPLSATNRRRLGLGANIMAKYSFKYLFWAMLISSTLFVNGSAFVAYSDPNSGFSLLSVIFWSTITVFFSLISLERQSSG